MEFSSFKDNFQNLQNSVFQKASEFPWNNAKAYCSWLANTHFYVSHSTRILALTAGTLPNDLSYLSHRFMRHTLEEQGHERLLLHDLKAMNSNLNDHEIALEMKFYLWSLYHWLGPAGSPFGILGWVISLEGIAAHMGPRAYQAAKGAWGEKACSFLRVHSQADQEHIEKALSVASQLPPHHLATVLEATVSYAHQYQLFLNKVSCKFSKMGAAA